MNHSYFLIIDTFFFFFLIYNTSARQHQNHRSAGCEHQTGGAQTNTTKTARTRPGRDLEEGLPVSVVQDDRRGRLVPAAPQRRRLRRGETKRCRRDGEHGRCQRSFYDKRCLWDWSDRKCFDQHCKLEAFARSTDRRGNGPPLCPPPDCSAAAVASPAADYKSSAGTLNKKCTSLQLGRLVLEMTNKPSWSALEQDTDPLLPPLGYECAALKLNKKQTYQQTSCPVLSLNVPTDSRANKWLQFALTVFLKEDVTYRISEHESKSERRGFGCWGRGVFLHILFKHVHSFNSALLWKKVSFPVHK